MTVFVDSDAIIKLASWGLLDECVTVCSELKSGHVVLPTAKYQLGFAGKRPRAWPTPTAEAAARQFVTSANDPTSVPSCEFDFLSEIPDVDAGEALLVAQAASTPNALLLTGDKRCLRALAASESAQGILHALQGRVICLEQALILLARRWGFENVRERVVESEAITLDRSVESAFGSGSSALEYNACGSLERRTQALDRDTKGLLVQLGYRFDDSGAITE